MSTLTFGAVGDISFAGNVGKNVVLRGPEEFFDELAWRLFQLAENRSWISEILNITEEKYNAIGRKTASKYTRPNYEYQR